MDEVEKMFPNRELDDLKIALEQTASLQNAIQLVREVCTIYLSTMSKRNLLGWGGGVGGGGVTLHIRDSFLRLFKLILCTPFRVCLSGNSTGHW